MLVLEAMSSVSSWIRLVSTEKRSVNQLSKMCQHVSTFKCQLTRNVARLRVRSFPVMIWTRTFLL